MNELKYDVVLVNRETFEVELFEADLPEDRAADLAYQYNVVHFGKILTQKICDYTELEKGRMFGDTKPEEKFYADYYESKENEDMDENANTKGTTFIASENDTEITITLYADDTGLYTDKECEEDNLVDFTLPQELVREWFYTKLKPKYRDKTFEEWYNNESVVDDFNGFVQFATEIGYVFKRPDNKEIRWIIAKERIIWGRDKEDAFIEHPFEAVECAANGGTIYDFDNMLHLRELLNMPVSFALYHKINDGCVDLDAIDLEEANNIVIKYMKGE